MKKKTIASFVMIFVIALLATSCSNNASDGTSIIPNIRATVFRKQLWIQTKTKPASRNQEGAGVYPRRVYHRHLNRFGEVF